MRPDDLVLLLKEGRIVEFNKCRPTDEINLSGIDLSGATLHQPVKGTYAKIEEPAYLFLADLSSSNLSGADLSGVYLESANLSHATLKKARLEFACLQRANLRGADLRNANLWFANLERANLYEANLSGAYLEQASLIFADLAKVMFDAETCVSRANFWGARLSNDLKQHFLKELRFSWNQWKGVPIKRY